MSNLIDCRANIPPFDPIWYIAICRPGQDDSAWRELKRRRYDLYRPLIPTPVRTRLGWQNAWRSLFPGYLFVQPHVQGWELLRTAPSIMYGNRALIKQNNSLVAIPHDDPAMKLVRETVERLSTIEIAAEPQFKVGDRVHIRKGPWMDFWATIEKLDGEARIGCLIDMLGRKVRARVPVEHISFE